jgi:glutathione S-transferase
LIPETSSGPQRGQKKLVIVGDTEITDGLAEHVRGADVLVIEATFLDRDAGIARDYGQPFGQVPWLTDGDISIFESGAILLYLGERSDALMAVDPRSRSETMEWVFAALNSVEMASLPWSILAFSGDTGDTPGWKRLDQFLKARLQHLEPVLAGREWLAGSFTVADILMADVLRLVDRFDGLAVYPACRDYVARATACPSFVKAHADQMAHFAAAD